MSDVVTAPPPLPDPPALSEPTGERRQHRVARIVTVIAGLLGVVAAVALPLLPVVQTTASLSWPQQGRISDVQAPLVSFVPIDLDTSIPCTLVKQLPADGGVLLSTAPESGTDAALHSMFVRVNDQRVDVITRNVVVASAPRAQVAGAVCHSIDIHADAAAIDASFTGLTNQDGSAITGHIPGDLRPDVVGVFSDLSGGAPADLSFHATIDSRFSSTPSTLKLIAMIVAVVSTMVALCALARLDGTDGRRHRRLLPRHWLRPKWVDTVVIGALVLWHFIGANTSDDGYLLTMARVSEKSGYMANYFRWFGVPEAPFGMPYYDLLAVMSKVTTASPWMRLPALIAGILCWLVISREVLPRLGRAVRHNQVAVWSAATVFLAFWLPYNNGLRPEPIIALGALVTWCSIERAIATGRLLPAGIAIVVAAFSLSAGPTGLMAVAALLAGARAVVRIIVRRRREAGTLPLLAPLLAAGTVVLVAVFADQTLATVRESTRVRSIIGPNLAWYQEFIRYYYLMVQTVDGSLARRFAVLMMFLCLVTTTVILLRRKQIPGAALGPSWRLLGVLFGTIFFMTFTPTKWTHHFGVYAGLAGSLAALTAVAISASALRSSRNRAMFFAALVFVLALTTAGINGYWYVSNFGIPWGDKVPLVAGHPVDTLLLALAVVLMLIAGWLHFRQDYTGPSEAPRRRGLRRLTGAPIAVVAGAVVLFEVLSFAKGAYSQYPAYSLAKSNLDAVVGSPCAMADQVLAEPDPNAGALQPIRDRARPVSDPLTGVGATGFSANGVPADLTADAVVTKPGQANTDAPVVGSAVNEGSDAGTEGGSGDRGVNGSTVKLPFGLDPHRTPVLGSYQTGAQEPASSTSSWYQLPAATESTPLIVITAAGRILSHDHDGVMTYGQSLLLEYGHREADGTVSPRGRIEPMDIGPAPSWRNLRVPRELLPADADAVRVVANDPNLTPDQWLAFTPPRVPQLQTLQQMVGSTDPVLLDWAVGLAFPCQRPFDHLNGVAEVPKYRILPDRPLAVSSTDTWQAGTNGGPLGWTGLLLHAETVPAYLSGDWNRDWGSLQRFTQLVPDATPAVVDTAEVTRSGVWQPAKLRVYQ
ncbi:arabinosyltransferase domain-containing protein [Speluncibacter jeojiensis]|uniref:arabinosyltransferase domain-containing protein n=1 Tax=Speluncibacter jeojiensis TaxID=2710754 RepID=UPI0038CD105E